ncbi:T9SS type A sorting domain-containing protein [Bacteroidota bacterium]
MELVLNVEWRVANIEIADMFGKVMLKEDLEAGKRKVGINVNKIPVGVYLLYIDVDNYIIRKKLVKI